MTAYISGIQFLGKDDELELQHAANLFCESLFGDPKVPINKLHRHVDIGQFKNTGIRSSDFVEPVMKGMAAGEQRYIAIKVNHRSDGVRYFQERGWSDTCLVLLHEGREENGLPNRKWDVKFAKSIFKDRVDCEVLEPAKIALLLTTGVFTHYEDGYLTQVRLDGSDHPED